MTIPAEFTPIPEAVSDTELETELRAQLTQGHPGFLLKHELGDIPTENEARALHDEHVRRVVAVLRQLHSNKTITTRLNELFAGFGSHALGIFHNDAHYISPGAQLLVHTTTLGYGNVYVAAPGTAVNRIVDYKQHMGITTEPGGPHDLLLQGFVDPELVHPRVYTSYARPGYTYVLAEQGPRSSWHRFDTDRTVCKKRTIISSIINDERPTHIDERQYSFGLDLAA